MQTNNNKKPNRQEYVDDGRGNLIWEPTKPRHTTGEWYVVENFPTEEKHDFQIACNCKKGSRQIAQIMKRNYSLENDLPSLQESRANAYIICKAVNNYSKLVEENERLQKELEEWKNSHSPLRLITFNKKLVESNRELLAALRKAMVYADSIGYGRQGNADLDFIDNAVKNANNLHF